MKNSIKTFKEAVAIMVDFLSLSNTIQIPKESVTKFIQICDQIYYFIRYESKTELIGSSLLLAYSPYSKTYNMKIIDFNYYVHHTTLPMFIDYNFLEGLLSVKLILEKILATLCI